jgi:hypothetical protein
LQYQNTGGAQTALNRAKGQVLSHAGLGVSALHQRHGVQYPDAGIAQKTRKFKAIWHHSPLPMMQRPVLFRLSNSLPKDLLPDVDAQ